MADHTAIEWTDATWNPITGCAIASPGCTNCYAMRLAGTRLKNHPSREGLTRDSKAGPVWTGEVRFNEQWLTQPLKWSRPRMIFVCAHGDLFAENVPDEWIDQVFAIMALAPQHTFQVLTKRAKRMQDYLSDPRQFSRRMAAMPAHTPEVTSANIAPILSNVWLGVSVEDQRRADERLPNLSQTPAAIRWVSAEPLIGGLDIRPWLPNLGWVVAGGESGPDARPMHVEWIRALRDQCSAAGVPFLFKQWGEWVPQVGAVDGWTINDDPEISRIDHRDWEEDRWGEPYRPMWCDDIDDDTVSRVGKRRAGRRLDDVEHNEFPKIAA